MTLDSIFLTSALLGAVGFTLAVGGAVLPLSSVSRCARGNLGRLWGGVLIGLALLVVIAGILGSDPDGVPWGMLAVLGVVAPGGVLSGIISKLGPDCRGSRSPWQAHAHDVSHLTYVAPVSAAGIRFLA